jgi:AbrB family looped-hinge helix DNA binding protein
MAELKLVRVQEKGQVTLPAATRRKLGLKKGDLVAVTETPEGVLITPQQALVGEALAQVGEALRDQRITLEELIESGREIRGQILKDKYGIDPDAQPRPGVPG